MKLELVATATFGLEAVVRREIEALGYKIIKTEDGRVTYLGDERAIARSNLWLRSADRVYVRMGEFSAGNFEELFQQTKALPWEDIIPADGKFPVVGTSVKSALHSVPACQSIVNKAVAARLGEFYCMERLPETGAVYRIRFAANKDRFLMMLDTSGDGLHKRGYRVQDVAAPMKETLAAALVQLSFYNRDRILVDTCCGSGTILLEAAMIARNIAPGLSRKFASEEWDTVPKDIWKDEKKKAYEAADFDSELSITGMDIDRRAVKAAKENAEEAGLADDMDIVCMDMTKWEPGAGIPKGVSADEHGVVISNLPLSIESQKCNNGLPIEATNLHNARSLKDDYVVVISNLPYAIRVGTAEGNKKIYKKIRALMEECPKWSFFLITADKNLEKELGRKADRRRKLYNGMIETQYYQFHGERPVKMQ